MEWGGRVSMWTHVVREGSLEEGAVSWALGDEGPAFLPWIRGNVGAVAEHPPSFPLSGG